MLKFYLLFRNRSLLELAFRAESERDIVMEREQGSMGFPVILGTKSRYSEDSEVVRACLLPCTMMWKASATLCNALGSKNLLFFSESLPGF